MAYLHGMPILVMAYVTSMYACRIFINLRMVKGENDGPNE